MERASYYQKYGTIRLLILSILTHAPFPRSKVKLQAYQREYSWQKRAPGLRKVSKKSVCYWRNSGYKNISSWKWRAYQHTQRLLLSSTFAIPSVISLSHRKQGIMHAHSLCALKRWTPGVL